MTTELDTYFDDLTTWHDQALALREVLRGHGLTEELKWKKPCYIHGGDNLAVLQPFKEFLALLFFKGALFKDPEGLLKSQGENTRSALRLEFTTVDQIEEQADAIRALVDEAIAVEKAGLKVERAELPDMPEEMIAVFEQDPELQEAFDELTPGRQRSYVLHVASAKQSATRTSRIERCRDKIISGKGFNEY